MIENRAFGTEFLVRVQGSAYGCECTDRSEQAEFAAFMSKMGTNLDSYDGSAPRILIL